MFTKTKTILCTSAVALLLSCSSAQGVTYDLDEVLDPGFTGGVPQVSFTQDGNDVLIDFINGSNQNIARWYLNYNPGEQLSDLSFVNQLGDGGTFYSSVEKSEDALSFAAVADGNYDIRFFWNGLGGGLMPATFTRVRASDSDGEVLVSDFIFGNDLDYLSGVQGGVNFIGLNTIRYNTVTAPETVVPEPGTYILLGSTLLLVACARKRRESTSS